jgi:hypothetical protein
MSDPQARIAALRSEGAGRLDPVRFGYLEALARRAAAQREPVGGLLRERLAAALADYEQRLPVQSAVTAVRRTPGPVAACPPLAQLNAHIRQAVAARIAAAAPGETPHEHELASVQRFRQAWHAGRSVAQVEQALERKPANAGPLNSHALVLHSLALMRELSPEYLRRFVSLVETLQWLEQASVKPPRVAREARARRSAAARR